MAAVKELTALRKRQKEQVDALKKLSNYDKITEMLERHGQNTPRSSPSGASRTPARANGAQAGGNLATPANANGQGQAFVTSPTPAQQLQAMQRGLNPPTTAQGKKVMQPHMVGDSRMGTPIRNPGQAGMPQTPTLVARTWCRQGVISSCTDNRRFYSADTTERTDRQACGCFAWRQRAVSKLQVCLGVSTMLFS